MNAPNRHDVKLAVSARIASLPDSQPATAQGISYPEAHERDKLEPLCRYISRPAIAEERLSLTAQGMVR